MSPNAIKECTCAVKQTAHVSKDEAEAVRKKFEGVATVEVK